MRDMSKAKSNPFAMRIVVGIVILLVGFSAYGIRLYNDHQHKAEAKRRIDAQHELDAKLLEMELEAKRKQMKMDAELRQIELDIKHRAERAKIDP